MTAARTIVARHPPKSAAIPGRAARARHGWWTANRFLVLRRAAQLGFLALFLTGPLFGFWIAKGTLASSLTLNVLPLTDPLVLAQSLGARHWPEATALLGAAIVLAVYLVLGGRTYCSWVCPVNPVTDLAAYLRRRLGIARGGPVKSSIRLWMLAMILIVAALTGTIAWELVNPITALWRTLVFGSLFGLWLVAAIFVFDLFVVRDGWCGHVCPVGAFYGLIGRAALMRVSARGRARCDDCLECYVVCPEDHVITPALREGHGPGPVILSGDCTACGRCADVCPERVFVFTHRFDRTLDAAGADGPGNTSMNDLCTDGGQR
ncbi:MAG: quinol dehydrogenase ferredoxin subunit NapH [Xanthobacteraceae bacterium]|nr:MAG: quinol dehydrogenase ferredoxin subunit NapH [Xanthobacteraceae bacterium]